MVLTGSCPWPGPWSRSYGAHLHCRPVRIQIPTANAVPSALPDKKTLRVSARETRARLAHPHFARQLAEQAPALKLARGIVVAGYHAFRDEADPRLLLQVLATQGAHIAFPRVTAKDSALDFHLVPDGEILQPGRYGIHEPLEHWPGVIPQTILVPLLGYDDRGYRLGYGGGYYDRTLAHFRQARAIGIGYSGQRMDLLPRDDHDLKLHAILTEKGLEEFPP
jgi:5-formyltetrahydrofolate cyclo-ligase